MTKERITLVVSTDLLERLQKGAEAEKEALSPHVTRLVIAGLNAKQLLKERDRKDVERADEVVRTRKVLSQASSRCSMLEKEILRLKAERQREGEGVAEVERARRTLAAQVQKLRAENLEADAAHAVALRRVHQDAAQTLARERNFAAQAAERRGLMNGAVATLLLSLISLWVLPSQSFVPRTVALLAMGQLHDPPTAGARLAGYPNGRLVPAGNTCGKDSASSSQERTVRSRPDSSTHSGRG